MLTKSRSDLRWKESLTSTSVPAEIDGAPRTSDRSLGTCICVRFLRTGFQAVSKHNFCRRVLGDKCRHESSLLKTQHFTCLSLRFRFELHATHGWKFSAFKPCMGMAFPRGTPTAVIDIMPACAGALGEAPNSTQTPTVLVNVECASALDFHTAAWYRSA